MPTGFSKLTKMYMYMYRTRFFCTALAFLSLTRSRTHLRRRNKYPFLSYGTQFPIPASMAYSHPAREEKEMVEVAA